MDGTNESGADGIESHSAPPKPNRRWLRMALAAFLLVVVALTIVSYFRGWSPTLVNLPDGSGRSLRLEIYKSYDGKHPAASFNVTEPSSVDAILDVLRQGVGQTDHKCGEIGKAAITFADGQAVTIEILPGHKSEKYEFRYQRHNYWVPRDAFFVALEKAGVDIAAIPKDSH